MEQEVKDIFINLDEPPFNSEEALSCFIEHWAEIKEMCNLSCLIVLDNNGNN